MTVPSVPTWKMSSGVGSFVLAFFCAARKIFFVARHGRIERVDDALTADEQLADHVRKDDDVPAAARGEPHVASSSSRRYPFAVVILEEHS